MIAWENEALLAANELGKDKFKSSRRVSLSSQSQPCRWSINGREKRHQRGGGSLPEISLLAEGQEIAAKNYYRPRDAEVAKSTKMRFQN